MFINRDYSRTEHDDWILHIQPLLANTKESVEVYHPTDHCIVGWTIQNRYE